MSYFIIQENGEVVSSYDSPQIETLNVNPDSVCGQAILNSQLPDLQQQTTTEGE